MPYKHEWLIENRVVLFRFWGDASVDDFRQAFEESAQLLITSPAEKVYYLHDWSKVESYPKNLREIRDALSARTGQARRIGWVIIFGTVHPIMRFLADVFFQMLNIRCRMFSTKEEALVFLQKADLSLPSIEF